jgi:DNA-directed RNA polymerase specialized sigma24 family protein
MSETRWPANSFDEARDEVIATLRTYRVERMNIQREKALLQEAITSLYTPASSNMDGSVKTQMKHGDERMLSIIGRVEYERRALDQEMDQLNRQEDKLNDYLKAIFGLPTFERRVVVGLYIDDKFLEEICAETGKSEDATIHHRKAAIRKLTRALYRVEVKTWEKMA